MAVNVDDLYCLRVERFGSDPETCHHHALELEEVEIVLLDYMATLAPGDRIELTLTRGAQQKERNRQWNMS